jgi:hypothetical protein
MTAEVILRSLATARRKPLSHLYMVSIAGNRIRSPGNRNLQYAKVELALKAI